MSPSGTDEPSSCSCDVASDPAFQALEEQVRALATQLFNSDLAALEATVNDVERGFSTMQSCIAGIAIGETGAPMTDTNTPVSDTDAPATDTDAPLETTEDVVETMETTAAEWAQYGTLDSTGMKCAMGADRTFKLTWTTTTNCLIRCRDDTTCQYATTDHSKWCIGCAVAPTVPDSIWNSYKVLETRRRLEYELEILRSENEAFRAENAALREALSKVRRN